jgi:hypothetical protein
MNTGILAVVHLHGRPVRLRDHAVDRYIERVKPALDRHGAVEDLARLIRACAEITGPPCWLNGLDFDGHKMGRAFADWLCLGDDVALPLLPSDDGGCMAVTCIARGGISDTAQRHRAHRRRHVPTVASRRVKHREGRPPRRFDRATDDYEEDLWDLPVPAARNATP